MARSSNYGWLCLDIDYWSNENFWVSLGGTFFPCNRDRTFCVGGYVYVLGTSDWFLEFEGEAELAPTYEPIVDQMGYWESFNVIKTI